MAIKQFFKKIIAWLKLYPWIISLLVVLVTYWQLPHMYFEQDEWQAFETYTSTGNQSLMLCAKVQRPLTCVFNTLEWRAFHTYAPAYGVTSLALILLITYVFYRLLRRLNFSTVHAVVASALFPIFTAGAQAITWFGAFSAILPSFLFAILAVDFFVQYVQKPTIKSLIFTLISFLISLYFKEETLWLGPVFLTIWLLYHKKQKNLKATIKNFLVLLGPPAAAGFIYLALERYRQLHTPAFSTLVSTTDSQAYLSDVIRAIFMLPISHLGQIVISPDYTVNIANALQLSIGTFSVYLFYALLVFFIYLFIRTNKKERPAIIVLLVWVFTGFISYAIFGKNPELLEGRYYFGTQAPLVALLVFGLIPDKLKSMGSWKAFGTALLIVIVGMNQAILHLRIGNSLAIATERQDIIKYIQKAVPRLPERSIIFAETTNYGYVGQAAAILPFQNGVGTTLRVVYQGKDQDYRALAKPQNYLWNLLNQGYDEVDGIGFGYFRDYTLMAEQVISKNVPIENVYAFRYIGKTMNDITPQVRSRLTVDKAGKDQVPRENWKVNSNNNAGIDAAHGIEKATDGDRRSDWSVPHVPGAFISVDMGQEYEKLTQITLTAGDGNSYPRVVRVEHSLDGQNWEGVDDIGTIDVNMNTTFSFPPKKARWFRVTLSEQVPLWFNWSLGDINAYTLKASQ